MSPTLASDAHHLALDLHAFVRSLDPARYREERASTLRQHLTLLVERVRGLAESAGASMLSSLRASLEEVSRILESAVPQGAGRAEWVALGRRLTPAYEALAASLADYQLHCPNIRPSNWKRSLFHAVNALWVTYLIECVLDPSWFLPITLPAFGLALSMEISRRYSTRINDQLMQVFALVAHPHEAHRVNSATWYTAAMVVLSLIGSSMIGAVAVIILGLADPAAAVFGRRYGKTKLANGRSLEGTTTFIVVGTLAALAVLVTFHPEVGLRWAFGAAFIAALFAGIAELYATYIDDNLAIPCAAAAGMLLAQALAGLA
jgi:dolichol kinase